MKTLKRFVMVLSAALLTACGGGGGGATGSSAPPGATVPPPPPVQAPIRTAITLNSDRGDTVGQGNTYSYSVANADIKVIPSGNHLVVEVRGDMQWSADFQTPGTDTQLKPGMYAELDSYVPNAGTAKGGLRWWGEARGCASSKGWFAIDSVTYAGSTLKSLSLRFERHCDGAGPALRGVVEFAADDKPAVAAPAAIPSDLWKPPAGFGSGSANEVIIESSAGEYVGQGKTYRYNGSNSDIFADEGIGRLNVGVRAAQEWDGTFKAMEGMPRTAVGYYPNIRSSYPIQNPMTGGMKWGGEGRGCVGVQGWYVVDAISYEAGRMTALDMRFEQRCDDHAGIMHGAVHWREFAPGAPVKTTLSAAGSWRPAAPIAASGNYMYVEGHPSGWPKYRSLNLYDSSNAVFTVTLETGFLHLDIAGAQGWSGNIQLNSPGGQLGTGAYDRLGSFTYPGSPVAGMTIVQNKYGCTTPLGWVAIDNIAYSAGKLSALDMRIEQVCDGYPVPMHAVLHWRADDPTGPAGPGAPPADAWKPPAEASTGSGNYFYADTTERNDGFGLVSKYRYTPADARIAVSESGGHLMLKVDGDERWTVDFQTMSSLKRLQPGYYDGLRRYPFHDPSRGGIDLQAGSMGCNESSGNVIVDSVSYENELLSAVQLRFEFHCERDTTGAVRGALRWSAADRSRATGPQTPIPASLWRPAAGATPASGNYVYVQSDVGEYIAHGVSTLHTPQNSQLTMSEAGGRLDMKVRFGSAIQDEWIGIFVPMDSLAQLQPGFYDNLQVFPNFNPARGGFVWYGKGIGCNEARSWVAIDSVTYVNGKMTALNARFEQHCELQAPALRGEIHWAG